MDKDEKNIIFWDYDILPLNVFLASNDNSIEFLENKYKNYKHHKYMERVEFYYFMCRSILNIIVKGQNDYKPFLSKIKDIALTRAYQIADLDMEQNIYNISSELMIDVVKEITEQPDSGVTYGGLAKNLDNMINEKKKEYGDDDITGVMITTTISKMPFARAVNNSRVIISHIIQPMLNQVAKFSYSTFFESKFNDNKVNSATVARVFLPYIAYHIDPVNISLTDLPFQYLNDEKLAKLAKDTATDQLKFMIYHELSHIEARHIPNKPSDRNLFDKILSEDKYNAEPLKELDKLQEINPDAFKEIEADLNAFKILLSCDENLIGGRLCSIQLLFGFYTVVENFKAKVLNQKETKKGETWTFRHYMLHFIIQQYGDVLTEEDKAMIKEFDIIMGTVNCIINGDLYNMDDIMSNLRARCPNSIILPENKF